MRKVMTIMMKNVCDPLLARDISISLCMSASRSPTTINFTGTEAQLSERPVMLE